MVSLEETELPGLGWKYVLRDTEAGDRLVLILHHGGKREIYRFRGEEDSPRDVFALNEEESRRFAAVLLDAVARPDSAKPRPAVAAPL